MKLLVYKDIPCPVLLKKEPDTFLIFFKNEQKWIYECSLGYGEIGKYAKQYRFNGKLHREKEPAIEYSSGTKRWYENGKLHRLDGPAIEWSDGNKEWWIEGKQYLQKNFNQKIEEMKRDGTYSL